MATSGIDGATPHVAALMRATLPRALRNVTHLVTLRGDASRFPEHPMSMPNLSNANVYQRLGIRTIVNASGPSTRLSGGIMRPEVAAAMAEASQWCVDVAELQGRASEILAEATGAEAGYVTAGASAALMLASAACLAGLDPAKMNRLPDTTGMANEVVVARSQRNMYDRAVVQAGARLVEVGIPDRFSGAGVRDAQAWEYEAAINERTAAILWVAQPHSEPGLPES